jgi:hypothetical protein
VPVHHSGSAAERKIMADSRMKQQVNRLIEGIVASIDASRASEEPYCHLVLDRVFPEDAYDAILDAMPNSDDYRPMHGRSRQVREDGKSTRVKIDLFPEYIRHLPKGKREVWDLVGRALCSSQVQAAFVRRLAPALERRFGPDYHSMGFYPIPILTRDNPGYTIAPHTDTHWKGITVQLYLPRDNSHTGIGTIFHRVGPDGKLEKATQMSFARNSGYAFAVTRDSWHSADPVGAEVDTRDSILHTYFVDAGLLRFLRNRGKRVGNFVLQEVRQIAGQ